MTEGIKETKELVEGMLSLSLLFAEVFKDGMNSSDFITIVLKMRNDQRFIEAFQGLSKIPAEVKDLDLDESYELLGAVIPYIQKLIGLMKE